MRYEFLDHVAVFGWAAVYVVLIAHYAMAAFS